MPGMILDGIFAAETIDSSGEVFDVKGADISSLETDGFVNYEHKDNSSDDKIGRIVYAKKIFAKTDCNNDREKMYWEKVKVPFIYGKARLFNAQEDHQGARSAAAAIRDMLDNGEVPVYRWSIEGSTLKRDGQRLTKTICRGVALTWKPCNKAALSGVLEDPQNKEAAKQSADILDNLAATVKSDVPGRQILSSFEMEGNPIVEPTLEDAADEALEKTMTGSVGDCAPSALTGGAALVREDIAGYDPKKFRNDAKAAVRDYDPNTHGEFRKFLKMRLPEASDQFVDHFVGLVDNYKNLKAVVSGAKVQKTEVEPGVTTPEIKFDPPQPENPLESKGAGAGATNVEASGRFSTRKMRAGEIKTPTGAKYLYFHSPSEGKHAGLYQNILHADDPAKSPGLSDEERSLIVQSAHEPWKRAMRSWMELNRLARDGKLPPSIFHLAGIFSAMSPNTSVPIQELYFGHYMDFTHEHGQDFTKPVPQKLQDEFHKLLNSERLPEFMQSYYANGRQAAADADADDDYFDPNKKVGATLASRPQGQPLLNFHQLYPFLVALGDKYRDNSKAMAAFLMHSKTQHDKGTPESKDLPEVRGFGPKLARYMVSMLGGGNTLVNDRHMMRALFDIPLDAEEAKKHALSALARPQAERLLSALDEHFFQRHPAVQKVLDMYPSQFAHDPHQATFPGFWLAWLLHPHYDRLRGWPVKAQHTGTDHGPFFQAAKEALDAARIPHTMPDWNQDDTSFDFGKNDLGLWNTSNAHIITRMAHAMKEIELKHGHNAALFFYYAYLIPALMTHEQAAQNEGAFVRKMEYLTVELKRLAKGVGTEVRKEAMNKPMGEVGESKLDGNRNIAQVAAPAAAQPTPVVHFNGNSVIPGEIQIRNGFKGLVAGERLAVVHQDTDTGRMIVVPHDKLVHPEMSNYARSVRMSDAGFRFDIRRLPKDPNARAMLVDMNVHHHPPYLHSKEQFDLAHGIDFTDRQDSPEHFHQGIVDGEWLKVGPNKDKIGYIKPHKRGGPTSMPTSSEAEGLYHNLAKEYFGLGEYVPTVAVFKHPKTEWMYSAIEGIPDASHFAGNADQHQVLHKLHEKGDLDKMLLMNGMLTNSDRHANNFMFGNGDTTFHLIDHGYTFQGEHGVRRFPHYWAAWADKYQREKDHSMNRDSHQLHPEAAKWALGLDADKLAEQMRSHEAPQHVINVAVDRLKALQDEIRENPRVGAVEAWGAMDARNDVNNYLYNDAKRAREESNPEAKRDKKIQGLAGNGSNVSSVINNLDTNTIAQLGRVFSIPTGDKEEMRNALANKIYTKLHQRIENRHAEEDKRWNANSRNWNGPISGAAERELNNQEAQQKGKPPVHERLLSDFPHLRGKNLDRFGEKMGMKRDDGEDDPGYRARLEEFLRTKIGQRADEKRSERRREKEQDRIRIQDRVAQRAVNFEISNREAGRVAGKLANPERQFPPDKPPHSKLVDTVQDGLGVMGDAFGISAPEHWESDPEVHEKYRQQIENAVLDRVMAVANAREDQAKKNRRDQIDDQRQVIERDNRRDQERAVEEQGQVRDRAKRQAPAIQAALDDPRGVNPDIDNSRLKELPAAVWIDRHGRKRRKHTPVAQLQLLARKGTK